MITSLPSSPKNPSSFHIIPIKGDNSLIEEVITLGRRSKKTLGVLPDEAFIEYANKGNLLVALDTDGVVIGYIVYRIRKNINSAFIIHLCVDKRMRKKGVATALWEVLKDTASKSGWDSIRVKCRRDYEHQPWARLQFTPRRDVEGRGQDGYPLTIWIYDFKGNDILENDSNEKLRAVIDTNIFFDLIDESGMRPEEAKVLNEPWVSDSVKLCIVDEIYNEINRNGDSAERAKEFIKLHGFLKISYSDLKYDENYKKIVRIMGEHGDSRNKRSDRIMIAQAVASEANLFLTRDKAILNKSEEIEKQFGLEVITPVILCSQIDRIEREHEYRPRSLWGTEFKKCAIKAEDIKMMASKFLAKGESQKNLEQKMREVLAKINPERLAFLESIFSEKEAPRLCYSGVGNLSRNFFEIPLFRTVEGRLHRTLIQHVLLELIRESSERQYSEIRVTDSCLSHLVVEVLRELYFDKASYGWRRIILSEIENRKSIIEKLTLASKADTQSSDIRGAFIKGLSATSLEEHFWPVKILGEGISNIIVPIKPNWAAQLFDRNLAEQDLFGALAKLALNRENVYYRSKRPSLGISTPARILWYVSRGGNEGTMAVRACSRLLAIEIDLLENLYKKYKNLGVYTKYNLEKIIDNYQSREIMAIKFEDTELFKTPVSLECLKDMGLNAPQSPRRISEEQFINIYKKGMNRI